MEVYISDRFRKVVMLHVIKNKNMGDDFRAPLILGIHGNAGDGKTYQCHKILEAMRVTPFLISGGELETHEAGNAAKLIRDTYLRASRSIDTGESKAAAIIINDIDAAIGDWGDLVQYTVNRQTVYSELMHLCDYPNIVQGFKTYKVPIITTGNDFSKLYKPLIRSGRMTAFEWKPTDNERLEIVKNIFHELSPSDVSSIMKRLEEIYRNTLPVSFYSALKSSCFDDILWGMIKENPYMAFQSINSSRKNLSVNLSISLELVVNTGIDMIENSSFTNHLTTGGVKNG